jgi:hypothetical protein
VTVRELISAATATANAEATHVRTEIILHFQHLVLAEHRLGDSDFFK